MKISRVMAQWLVYGVMMFSLGICWGSALVNSRELAGYFIIAAFIVIPICAFLQLWLGRRRLNSNESKD